MDERGREEFSWRAEYGPSISSYSSKSGWPKLACSDLLETNILQCHRMREQNLSTNRHPDQSRGRKTSALGKLCVQLFHEKSTAHKRLAHGFA